MNLDLNTEQTLLKNSAVDFLSQHCTSSILRSARQAEEIYPQALWQAMAEMGWMGLVIDERFGGSGCSLVDLTVLLEAMGAACVPAPFFTSAVISALALQMSTAEPLKSALLPALAAGKLVSSLALIDAGNSYGLGNIHTTARREGDQFVLDGCKLFVEYAQGADYFLTVVNINDDMIDDTAGEGPALLMVDAKSCGISLQAMPTLDYSRQCELRLQGVNVPLANLVAKGEEARELLLRLEEMAGVAKSAEILGLVQKVLDVSVTYAKDRNQFGQAIGGFQAIQHHCANMAVEVDSLRYLTALAAWTIALGLPATKAAAMAKAFASTVAVRIPKLGHQIHGAISFCDDLDMHWYLRKSQAAAQAFGGADYHLEKVAQQLGL